MKQSMLILADKYRLLSKGVGFGVEIDGVDVFVPRVESCISVDRYKVDVKNKNSLHIRVRSIT